MVLVRGSRGSLETASRRRGGTRGSGKAGGSADRRTVASRLRVETRKAEPPTPSSGLSRAPTQVWLAVAALGIAPVVGGIGPSAVG